MEKRATKKRYLIFLLCICMIVPQVLLQKPQKAVAASDAIVIVNVLNVRTGPGTTYDRVVVDGIEAYLVGQQEIEVTGTSGEWYQINASFRGKDISGYVYGPYVSLMTEIAPADKPKPGPKDPAEKPGSADKPNRIRKIRQTNRLVREERRNRQQHQVRIPRRCRHQL